MNLFNIGVEGQFLVAALVAAVVGGEAWVSGYLNTALAILAGMVAGALYAGIAGVLRAYRGVSEVISTIMLNSVAVGLTAFLLRQFKGPQPEGSFIVTTKQLPESSWIPNISIGEGAATEIYGFIYIAAFVGPGLLVPDQQDAVRLRPPGHRPVDDRRGGQRHQHQADDRHRDAAVRRVRRPGRTALHLR